MNKSILTVIAACAAMCMISCDGFYSAKDAQRALDRAAAAVEQAKVSRIQAQSLQGSGASAGQVSSASKKADKDAIQARKLAGVAVSITTYAEANCPNKEKEAAQERVKKAKNIAKEAQQICNACEACVNDSDSDSDSTDSGSSDSGSSDSGSSDSTSSDPGGSCSTCEEEEEEEEAPSGWQCPNQNQCPCPTCV